MDIYNVGSRVMDTYIYHALDGCVMIDTGYEHSLRKVEKRANKQGIALSEVKYVFLTHAHGDHAEDLLQGKILFTPGHTSDSISLKIDNIIFAGMQQ